MTATPPAPQPDAPEDFSAPGVAPALPWDGSVGQAAPQPGDAERLTGAALLRQWAEAFDGTTNLKMSVGEIVCVSGDDLVEDLRVSADLLDAHDAEIARLRAERDADKATIRDWEYTVKWMRPRMDKAEYELERARAAAEAQAGEIERLRVTDVPHLSDSTRTGRRQPEASGDVERAREIIRKYIKLGVKFVVGKDVYAEWMKDDIVAALTAARREGAEAMREIDEPVIEAARAYCAKIGLPGSNSTWLQAMIDALVARDRSLPKDTDASGESGR